MRSQLTRNVFRRLLSNEPLVFHCSNRSPHTRSRHAASLLRLPARRTLFGFSAKATKEPRDPQLAPGLSKMLDLNMMNEIHARPPPSRELVQAWRTFFEYKFSKKEPLNNFEAQHALKTFKYLQQALGPEGDNGLEIRDLQSALRGISRLPPVSGVTHNEFARLLYTELSRRGESGFAGNTLNLVNYVSVLSNTGDSIAARDLAISYRTSKHKDTSTGPRNKCSSMERGLWKKALAGFAREDNELELLKTVEMGEASGMDHRPMIQEIMISFYASKNDVQNTKKWLTYFFEEASSISGFPTAKSISAILALCIRTGDLEWCKSVLRGIFDKNPPKPVWDVLFRWAAGTLGKGVEDVERMIDVMIRVNPDSEAHRPDAHTMNGLVELAMSVNDAYLAERYIVLMRKYDVQPNVQTFLLQLDYRISANDLTGARAAYEALQAEEVLDDCDLPVINRYLCALCTPKPRHYDRIVAICSDLEERKARLEPDTVSALTMVYLSQGELNDVLDTLQANVYYYTLPERLSIIKTFVNFCLDRHNGTAEAWEAYEIFRHVFQETPVALRTQLMNEFFARKRSDMACHVFGHMRQHLRREGRPVIETYIDCFRGIAHCEDKESLDMVHNMLKMDSSIEPNTKLFNSLMMAYTECDDRDKALDFWDDITNSTEGPSYESLELVFKACHGIPFGDRTAREVWVKIRRMEIEVTKEVFSAYIGALAGQAKVEEAEGMIETAEKVLGIKPDAFIIGTFYNDLPGQNRKDMAETWAKDQYPKIWTELQELGQRTMLEGHRMFNMEYLVRT